MQPRVHRPEQHVAGLGALAQPVDVVEQPADLRSGEVRRERQPAAVAEAVGALVAAELAHEMVRAHVLPVERVVHRHAGRPVPQHRRLALVGDPERDEVARAPAAAVASASPTTCCDVAPDLHRVVLDVPGPREDVVVLDLADGDDPRARASKTRQREEAVPWSTEATKRSLTGPSYHFWRHHGIAPRSRDTARAASRTNDTRSLRGAPSSHQPLDGAGDADRADGDAAAVDDRGGDRDLADDELLDVGGPAALDDLMQLRPRARPLGDRRRGEAAAARRRPARRPRSGWRRAGPCPWPWRAPAAARRPRAPGGCRRAGTRGARRAPASSCSVPIRTLSPLRAASESDQLSARVRSSLPSR